MTKTKSTMKLEIGDTILDFTLFNPITKKNYSLGQNLEQNPFKGVLVFFICNHCPYVIHISNKLSELTATYIEKGIKVLGINSNNYHEYPADAPERMIEEVQLRNYSFPYLLDESQEIAKKFYAACTPDFFLFNQNKQLVYRGQFDDSRPGNQIEITGEDLSQAIENLLNNFPPLKSQKASLGCNIKWKENNEPTY